ncbi:non-ribosomal peptide synthetase [Bacillus gaemokensis]|uniref:Carrier domain-containing protein n=1 Tax=Bacillus gaemokensis TaxID=574375 RepID=A0A073K9T1_9BACI|nr:non-ribosomal peptide synthetase [Bacillus gaemokensis]KEK23217.1 hypothetical protein BAGA_10710 [Bacillus gaemokensis]KYG37660.1 hypothetical protein AZF08_23050 [Bacillus gaemokensis]
MNQVTRKLYPLTNAQKRVWFIERMYQESGLMNLAGSVRFSTNICPNLLRKAIHQFIQENESIELQVIQESQNDEGFSQQLKADKQPYDILLLDFSTFSDPENMAEAWIETTTKAPFKMDRSPLFLFALLQISESETWLYLKTHHIISDGVSLYNACNEIADIYLHFQRGRPREISKKPSYLNTIEKENKYFQSKRYLKDKQFWQANFETLPDLLYVKKGGMPQDSLASSRYEISLDKDLRERIDQFCNELEISPSTFFTTCLYTYLYRITGKKDITLGQITRNRTGIQEKSTFGMFVNMLPFRYKINPLHSFENVCRNISKKQHQLLRHQKYPYNHILKGLREQHQNISKLFNISVEFQVLDFQKHEDLPYVIKTHPCGSLDHEMVVHIKDRSDLGTYRLEFEYQSLLFKEEEIKSWSNRYMELLKDALLNPVKKVTDLNILSESEAKQILFDWNQTEREYRLDQTFIDLFNKQVKITPDSIALEFNGENLTYLELDERTSRLAKILRNKKVKSEDVVAIMLPRGIDLIVSMIGIQKAGGAYLAIDPDYPINRISYMLIDSQSCSLLTTDEFKEKLSDFNENIIDIKQLHLEDIPSYPCETTDWPTPDCADLAYLIYTSGSTGNPKGVMVEHRGLSNLIYNTLEEIGLTESSRVLQFASCSFDTSVFEIFPLLCSGGTLILENRESLLPGKPLADVLRKKKINMVTLTPSVLMKLSSYGEGELNKKMPHLKIIKSAGEACPFEVADYWSKYCRFINGYGPAESTVWATTGDYAGAIHPDIGRPLKNITIYILDENQNVVPPGVVGEIYIGGTSLARGYLNRPELTAEKYIQVDFQRADLEKRRLYKTGDLARFLPDGKIEYLGRNDSQIKIRGQRVELSEIENVLEQHSLIKQAVAVVKDDAKSIQKIVVFILLRSSAKETSILELRTYLQDRLPLFMIPSQFKIMKELPLSPNGKVDRLKLKDEMIYMEDTNVEYKMPISQLEKTLSKIWAEALGLKQVGVEENFFDLGGDSFSLLWVCQKAEEELDNAFTVIDMFRYPTIRSFVNYIRMDKVKEEKRIMLVHQEEAYLRQKQRNRQKSLRRQWRDGK